MSKECTTTQSVGDLPLLNDVYAKYGKLLLQNHRYREPLTPEEYRVLLTDEAFCNKNNSFYCDALMFLPLNERVEFILKYGSNLQMFLDVVQYFWEHDKGYIPELIKQGIELFHYEFVRGIIHRTRLLTKQNRVPNWIVDELLKHTSAQHLLERINIKLFEDPQYVLFHPKVNRPDTKINSYLWEHRVLNCFIVLKDLSVKIQLSPWNEEVWSALIGVKPSYLNKFARKYPEGLSWLEKQPWFKPTKTIQKILDKRDRLRALTGE